MLLAVDDGDFGFTCVWLDGDTLLTGDDGDFGFLFTCVLLDGVRDDLGLSLSVPRLSVSTPRLSVSTPRLSVSAIRLSISILRLYISLPRFGRGCSRWMRGSGLGDSTGGATLYIFTLAWGVTARCDISTCWWLGRTRFYSNLMVYDLGSGVWEVALGVLITLGIGLRTVVACSRIFLSGPKARSCGGGLGGRGLEAWVILSFASDFTSSPYFLSNR